MAALALPSSVRIVFRAVILALLAFAIFGPLLNLLLWAFAERWYFPNKLPLECGADRRLQPRRGDTCRLCAGAAQAAVARGDSARVPAAAGGAEPARLRQYRAGVLPDRAQRHDIRRRTGSRLAWIGARGVDRVGGVRLGRYVARGGVAQPRRVALDLLSHGDAAAGDAGADRQRDLRLPRIAR